MMKWTLLFFSHKVSFSRPFSRPLICHSLLVLQRTFGSKTVAQDNLMVHKLPSLNSRCHVRNIFQCQNKSSVENMKINKLKNHMKDEKLLYDTKEFCQYLP